MLLLENDYSKLPVNLPSEAQDNIIYRFFDEYRCSYIFLQASSRKKLVITLSQPRKKIHKQKKNSNIG